MTKNLTVALLSLFCAAALAAANEVVVLKGGKTLELSKPYVLRGSQAVMTLKDGTVVSVAAADIDLPATRAARRPAQAPEVPAAALTPVEAARAQKGNAKARLKIGDADVTHTLEGAEPESGAGEGTEADAGGDAKLDVVDFDQRPTENAVAVKGTLRNSGKVPANNVALSIAAMDATGKVVASTTAAVSAGSLDAGSSATFTASLPMAAKAATLRFTPRWSSPAPAPRPATGAAAGSASAPAAAAPGSAPAAPAKPATPPPAPVKKEPAYRPQPDYAPPPANAPMEPTGDIHTGYIPGAHEETPPPPPPPPQN